MKPAGMDGVYSRIEETPESGFLACSIGVALRDMRGGQVGAMGI